MQYLAAAAAPYAPPFIIGHRSHALIPRPSGGPGAVWHFIVMEAFGGGVEASGPCSLIERSGEATEWIDLLMNEEKPAPRPDVETAQIFASALAGLTFMHAAGVLHLDVKAQNVLVSRKGAGGGGAGCGAGSGGMGDGGA